MPGCITNFGIFICWLCVYPGDFFFKRRREIKGSFIYAGVSNWGPGVGFFVDSKVTLDNVERTSNLIRFKTGVASQWQMDVKDKLVQFQDEFARRLRG
jgi:hypothetical protein